MMRPRFSDASNNANYTVGEIQRDRPLTIMGISLAFGEAESTVKKYPLLCCPRMLTRLALPGNHHRTLTTKLIQSYA